MGILQKIHIFTHNGSRLIYEKTTYFVFINLYFRPTDKRKAKVLFYLCALLLYVGSEALLISK